MTKKKTKNTVSNFINSFFIRCWIILKNFWIKHWWKTLQISGFLIMLGITLLITNQVVQPLFSPRISEMEITPLHIKLEQSNDFNDIRYFGIYEVSYVIETPFFYNNKPIVVELPGRLDDSTFLEKNAEWTSYYTLNHPYYIINLSKNLFKKIRGNHGWIDIKLLERKIPLIIKPNAREMRKITVKFWLREEIDSLYRPHLTLQDSDWYSANQIAPTDFKRDFATEPEFIPIGYAVRKPYNSTYEFGLIKIRSLSDIEIENIAIETHDVETVCDGVMPLKKVGKNKYILTTLKPKETKTFFTLTSAKEIGKNKEIMDYDYVFNFTSSAYPFCYGIWREQKELLK
ncbi:hypothetical protein KY366_03550 [Candidatus Woesearchaeota archaeon]|nr:hypothetical protein [Candidatus Woesearchaeota archaeon]